ncbi:MAG: class C sortase [Solobacterium sp.]|nr:class C sortase [Solobacterium sp.]
MWIQSKTSRLSRIAALLFIALGLCLIAYPAFSDRWNALRQSRAVAVYSRVTGEKDEIEIEAELRKAQDFNARLSSMGNARFALEEDSELHSEYERLLDVTGTGIMAYIEIPGYRAVQPVYHGTDEAVLQVAVGHLEGTSLPTGQPGTHAAFVGHDGLPSARLFTDITKMKEGDVFLVHVYDRIFAYEADRIITVEPGDLSALEIVPGQEYATLITCVPYGVNSHRLLVRGHRTEIHAEEEQTVTELPEVTAGQEGGSRGLLIRICLIAALLALHIAGMRAERRKHDIW